MPDGSEMPKTKSAKANTMEEKPAPNTQEVAPAEPERTVVVERRCRGRLGGSAFLLSLAVSRARHHGRRVIPVDGDYKSETLTRHYPPGTADGAVVPKTRDGTGFSAMMVEQMDLMAEDRVSRVVDVSGGGSEIEQFLNNLNLPDFCRDMGIGLLSVCMLGPEREDFQHLMSAVSSRHLIPRNMLIVFNEYLIPAGSNAVIEFGSILNSQDYKDMEKAGAKGIFVDHLTA